MAGRKTRKVRYAVVGLGHIAQVAVLPAFRNSPNSEIGALVSGSPVKLRKLGRKYGVPREAQFDYGRSLTDIRLSGIDAVYVCLPNHLHAEYATRAAVAGLHVLCEKPLGVRRSEAAAMARAAEEAGVRAMTAYRLHFEPSNLEAIRQAWRQRKLGELRIFNSTFSMQVRDPGNIRLGDTAKGGGPLWDIGIYCINAARQLFRAEPIDVTALAETADHRRFKATFEAISVSMRFPDHRLASLTCSFGAADCGSYDLVGTKGRLHLEDAYEYAEPRELTTFTGGKRQSRRFAKNDQFSPELTYFSRCILRRNAPEPSFDEGMRDVAVIEAILRSVETGRTAAVERAEPRHRHAVPEQASSVPGIPKPATIQAKAPGLKD